MASLENNEQQFVALVAQLNAIELAQALTDMEAIVCDNRPPGPMLGTVFLNSACEGMAAAA